VNEGGSERDRATQVYKTSSAVEEEEEEGLFKADEVKEEEEEEEEEGLFKADEVKEEDPERDRATPA